MNKFKAHLDRLTDKCTHGNGLLEYAAAHDYNPCITRTLGMRYACRRAECGFISKSEADWFIATQPGHKREYWFCAACGYEFKYGLNKAGQDNEYQHVIFMSIPWHDGGYRTMCARAVEPTNEQKAMILALKGITAAACLSIPAGSKVGLMQLVIETNKCFDEMVGDKFPRTTLTCKRPMHVSLGEMEVKDGGVLSLEEKDVGTRMIFYDINKAEKEGHFGPEPVIWEAPEMHFALEMISNALDLEGDEWEKHVYSPTMWQDEDGKRRRSASPQQRTGLEALRNLTRNPSLAAAHMRNQPVFSAKDVGLDREDLENPRHARWHLRASLWRRLCRRP